jgi:hypothetical protein
MLPSRERFYFLAWQYRFVLRWRLKPALNDAESSWSSPDLHALGFTG